MRVAPEKGVDIRWRPRDGRPSCILELITQFLWKWRVELALLYLVLFTVISILWQVSHS